MMMFPSFENLITFFACRDDGSFHFKNVANMPLHITYIIFKDIFFRVLGGKVTQSHPIKRFHNFDFFFYFKWF